MNYKSLLDIPIPSGEKKITIIIIKGILYWGEVLDA